MSLNHWKGLLAATLVLTGVQARAADIDLFAGVRPAGVDAPNVLIVLDNAANFSASVTEMRCSITAGGVVKVDGTGTAPTNLDRTAGAVEQCALYSAIQSLEAKSDATVNLGLMGFNAGGMKQFNPASNTFSAACVGGTGGCLLMPLTPLNASNKPNMLEWIRNWALSGGSDYVIKANNSANGAVMQEAWAYFFGKVGVSGRDYASIVPAGGCARKNVIFVGNDYRNNATPGDGSNEDSSPLKPLSGTSLVVGKRAAPAATAAQLASVTGTISTGICAPGTTTLQTAEGKGAYALNWARYMKAQGVTTFSIGVLGPTCNAEYAGHLAKMGADEIGGGKYFATTNYEELKNAFLKALGEVQSVNSVFAAVSLPVSVNTQGSYLNQVYVGMFRPQQHFNPRWDGNLKQYKLGEDNGALRLLDADGVRAVNNLTGFITECARSYWTPNTTDNYWELDPSGGCLTVTGANSSNYPDGNIVEKGAQAYKLRSLTPSARTAKTCSPVFANCTSMTEFSTDNAAITQALLNPGGTDRDVLINWARGQNNNENELSKGLEAMRPSVHGDVVHSRPVPVNHGSVATPSIVVYYGGNDGYLRAVNGNRGSATDASVGGITSGGITYAAGAEMWSFMPPEFYGKIKRLRDNQPSISFPGSLVLDAKPKDYGIDGPITAFQGSIGGSTKAYVYATMRRGGRVLYAFDVTIPGSPALLWKKGCPNAANDTDCSTGFSGIGQTWSSLKSVYASGYGSGTSPLLITGGGYDDCEDYDAGTVGGKNHNCAVATTKGNKVFVLDTATGAVVKAFPTDRAVIADSTIVRDTAGMAKYAYTADMGGNVYRIAFGGVDSSAWTITKIASLGCDTPAACTDSVPNRKFMFAPSVATTDNETYYVLLGSGDREKPVKEYVSSNSVTNYFFMLKDKPTATDWLSSENATCGVNVMCKGSLLGILTSAKPSDADLAAKKGWYLGLAATEQVVTSSVIVFGVVSFSTHQPAVTAANACTNNLGTTRVYNIGYLNAASANGTDSRYEDLVGDGLPPSPVAGLVMLDNGKTVPFCIGCSKNSPIDGGDPKPLDPVVQPKGRLYWYLQK
nr:PilC/PilY family type IV pilus protein [Rhodoferax sp.]